MAVIQNSFTGNGSTTTYSFTFPYLKTADIKASIDAAVTTAFTLPTATTLQFNSAPANGAKIKIYRETDADALTATFYAGSAIKSEDLNDNFTQNLYGVQEVTGRYMSNIGGTMTGDLTLAEDADIIFEGATDDAHETKLTVADPTADRTITLPNITGTVVTTGDTGTVATAMIAADAITGAKIADDAIDSEHYNGGSIDTAHLADNAVTQQKIADDAVGSDQLAASSVHSENIVDGTILTADLANNAITADKIASNAVTTAKIANDAITADKIADDAIDSEHYNGGSIDTVHLANNAVETNKIADTAVTEAKLASNSVTLAKMTDNSVGTSELVDDAVTADKIANSAVHSQNIVDGTILTGDIANDAITDAKLADNAVNSEHYTDGSIDRVHLAADVIDSTKLADNAVGTEHIQTNAVTTNEIADAELSTLAGMQSGTASILAGGTALTATLDEINIICDGKTVQTTITNSDTNYPTSGAVVDYVAAQLAPIGGLEVIANDASFPEVQPAAGVVISIADAGGLVVNGSGVSTTGRTVASTPATVTINGINSAYNSSTVTNGVGFLVSSTGSGQVYNFHKSVIRDQDILSISSDIDDFANRYRVGSSNPSSSNDAGDLFYNTTTNKLLTYNATSSAWEEAQSIGDFYISTISSFSGTGGNSASFNGSAYKFTISNAPTNAQQLLVSVNGVVQKPNAGTSQPSEGFALDGSAIIFSSAPATGSDYFITVQGSAVNVGSPSDNTVSTAKIQNGAVTTDKLGSDAVTGAKIADDAVGAEHIEDLDADVKWLDTKKAVFGTGDDLQILHDGSNSIIQDVGTGNLVVAGDNLLLMNAATSEYYIKCTTNGAVELYYDNVLQTKTTSTGLHLADSKRIDFGTGSDLKIYHDGSNSQIREEGTGNLMLISDNQIRFEKASPGEAIASFNVDGACELYYDNSKTFETVSGGAKVTGTLETTDTISTVGNLDMADSTSTGNNRIRLGTGDDLEIYHSGSHSFIKDSGTGNLQMWTNQLSLLNAAGSESMIQAVENAQVELYYDNAKVFETKSYGATVKRPSGGSTTLEVIGCEANGAAINMFADDGDDDADKWQLWADTGGSWILYNKGGGSWKKSILTEQEGAVKLYHNNNEKFETTSVGCRIGGSTTANTAGDDLVIEGSSDRGLTITAGTSSSSNIYFGDTDDTDVGRIGYFHSDNTFNITAGGHQGTVIDSAARILSTVAAAGQTTNCYEINKAGSGVDDTTAQNMILFRVGGSNRSGIESGSGGTDLGAFYSTSDRRAKTNFRTYTGGWDKIKQIPVKLYDELSNDDTKELIGDKPKTNCLGWIADELQQVFPEAVRGTKDAVDENGKPIFQTITQQRIFPDVVQALQAAITKIETLETKVAALEAA